MLEKINALKAAVEQLTAANAAEVEALRIKYLSKKGEISELMNDFRTLSPEDKRTYGAPLNELKALATDKINALREALDQQDTETGRLDFSRTASPIALGTRHPLSIVRNEIVSIFSRLGFTVAEGPEIEDDWHVFSSLNFAADHPARDMQDTFFIQRSPSSYPYLECTVACHGEDAAAYPHHLSGPCIPQRGHLCACPLLLPSGRGVVCRRACVVCRPEADSALFRTRDVWP